MRLCNGIIILSLVLIILVAFTIPYTYAMKITKYEGIQNNISTEIAKLNFQSGFNESVGINDNGSALINGQVVNYYYATNSLMAYFAYYGGNFYSGPPINSSGFSVQLNSNFNVTNSMTLWAQDVFDVQSQNGLYYVYVLDNLWNSTYPSFSINQSLVSGYGNFSTSNNQVFYYSFALTSNNIISYVTFTPFYLYTKMILNQSNGYPQIYMYYDFKNETYNSGWILYDIITIRIKSNNPQFLIGVQRSINSYDPYAPFVTQWVVGGEGGGSQLSVYSWNASMLLYYEYNGNFYSVPDSISLQPSIFTAYATAENVNQFKGITEYYNYNNSIGLVYQTQGYNKQEFLWQPNYWYTLNGHIFKLYFTPPEGEWKIIISSNSGYYNETFGHYSPITYLLPSGQYNLTATLYAGPNPVVTFVKSFNISGGIVNVSSPVPFYFNSTTEHSGIYEFSKLANLTFPLYFYQNSTSRMAFKYLIVNNKIIKDNSITLYANANVTAVYQQQYYLTINKAIPAQINGINTTLASNWYNESTVINIFKYYYFNNTVREMIISNVSKLVINQSLTIWIYSNDYQYYVYITLPNETINGWYNKSSLINLPKIIYINNYERYIINQSNIIVINEPINTVAKYIKQFLVTIMLPNGSTSNWYNENYVIKISPQIIYNGSNIRYVINQSILVTVNKSLTIKVPYYTQYYLTINKAIPAQINGINTTLASNWYNESTVINIFKYYYFNNTVREMIISNVSKLSLRNPVNINVSSIYQFYVLIILPNGTIANWYNVSSTIKLPMVIYNGSIRYMLNQTNEIVIKKPINLTPTYVKQYYVKIVFPNETINQWFNANSTIILPKIIFNDSTRYVLNQSDIILVNRPLNLTPNYIKQYYAHIMLPNGTINGWFNSNSLISIPKIIYNGSIRYVINQSNSILLNHPINKTINYVKQYLVIVNLPNGSLSSWINKSSSITLPKFIYISKNERYAINQSNSIIILSPMNLTPNYVKQFLVTINGISNWYNSGSIIRLYEQAPIYEIVRWVGNYTLPNNSNITVNGPIIENSMVSTNITFVGGVGAIAIIIIAAVVFISRRH